MESKTATVALAGPKLRGRPGNEALRAHREQLLAAASEEFFSRGYRGASLDRIAAQAGVSKVTIYRRYGAKAGLFEAVALRSVENMRREIREVRTASRPPADVLLDFALAAYEGATRSQTVAVTRLAIAEAGLFPEIAKTLWDHRFETLAPLRVYLEDLRSRGVIAVPDAMGAAIQLTSMVTTGVGSLMDRPIKSPAARRDWAKSAVALFLDGCRVQGTN